MSEMMIVTFETETGAAELASALEPLREDMEIEVQDITIVTRGETGRLDLKSPRNVPLLQLAGGAFWGAVIGAAFMVPVAGAIVGTAAGAATGTLRDPGIDSTFLTRIGETLPERGSALCLLVRKVDEEALISAIAASGLEGEVITAPVSRDHARQLRAALASRAA